MGGGDYCAVYRSSNGRRKPEKTIVMDQLS